MRSFIYGVSSGKFIPWPGGDSVHQGALGEADSPILESLLSRKPGRSAGACPGPGTRLQTGLGPDEPPGNQRPTMRAEIETFTSEIKQSLELLRGHL